MASGDCEALRLVERIVMFGWFKRQALDITDEVAVDARLIAEAWEIVVSVDGAEDMTKRVTGIPGRFPVYAESRAKGLAESFAADGVWDKERGVLYPPSRITSVSIRKVGGEASGSQVSTD
jgi:hypothetical protein